MIELYFKKINHSDQILRGILKRNDSNEKYAKLALFCLLAVLEFVAFISIPFSFEKGTDLNFKLNLKTTAHLKGK